MVRKLALAVSLALGTVSVPAHALGLGDLSSGSVLNQNFKGDIALLSVATDDIDGIRVKLADADAFDQAGVDRPYYLSRLKFTPTVTGSGEPVIRVTSDFPIREPFLNFLVEVNWPNGRLLREYTVLLDPPTTTRRRPPAIQPTQTTQVAPAPAVQQAAPAPAPTAPVTRSAAAASPAVDQYGPVQANETAWGISEKLRPSGVTVHQMMMALLAANPQAFSNNNINRLRRGQILRVPTSEEARRLSAAQARSEFQAQYQDWLAQKTAPKPTPQPAAPAVEPAAVDTMPAEEESSDQLKIATARPLGEGEPGAGDDATTTAASEELESRLLVARENAETSRQEAEALRGRLDDLESRLTDMQKLLSLKDEQLARLQDRMTAQAEAEAAEEAAAAAETEAVPPVVDAAVDAEVQVPEPTSEAAVGDAEPSEVALVPGPDSVAAEAEATVEAADAAMTDAVAAGDDYRIADIPPQVDADAVVAEFASQAAEPAADTAPASEPVGEAVAPAPAEVTPPVSPEPAAPVAEADTPSPATAQTAAADDSAGPGEYDAILNVVRENIVPVGIGSILLMMLIGLIATRGRREDSDRYATAGASAAHREAVPPGGGAALGAAGAGLGVGASTLTDVAAEELQKEIGDTAVEGEVLPGDLTEADLSALQEETGEVDPVSEADVYIAYGRYQHAEQLLQQALEQDPGRVALKHKLLEVHYATRNSEAFTALAEEMSGAGEDMADPTAWGRAQDMGRELAPEHALFEAVDGPTSELAELGEEKSGGGATVDEDTLSLNELDISELTAAYDEDASSAESSLSGGMDQASEVTITLDSESLLASEPEPSSELAVGDTTESSPSISLEDLESLEFEMPAAESDAGTKRADSEPLSESFDLDSMLDEATAGGDSSLDLTSDFSADDLQAELDELSDLSVLEPELDSTVADSGEESPLGLVSEDTGAGAPEQGLDEPISLDEAFDLDEPTESDSALTEEPKPDLGASEDVATKLDLARAYVEMGDSDGARGILEEVVSEGNDAQRSEAEDLLSKLS